jgi:Xaa-Pro aminopeptidase
MFPRQVYDNRRKKLLKKLSGGIAVFLGNSDIPYNYRSNPYHFRQDSTFSYFFGLNEPELAGLIDIDENKELLFGDDIDIEDIIWMGNLPSLQERASKVGISQTFPSKKLANYIKNAQNSGRKIHFIPPYRGESILQLEDLLGISKTNLNQKASPELIKAVIDLRLVKTEHEVAEIEKMVEVAYKMHTYIMRKTKPGISEQELAGAMEGIALSYSHGVSFPIILSMNGETLHNHYHDNLLKAGRLLLTDAGSESELLYASDITRTIPVNGKFSPIQKDIYNIVLEANLKTLSIAGPQISYREVHLNVAKIIANGLKNMGLMKGNVDDAIEAGAHALFFPHGLGHALGMDVHDLEGLGEDFVGYDNTLTRSNQFGLAYLRFARKPNPGYVLTDEPGIYFIPELIDLWRGEKKFTEFINYDKVESLKGFGGIRIEDDILITENGCRLLGKPIPKTVEEIENIMAG